MCKLRMLRWPVLAICVALSATSCDAPEPPAGQPTVEVEIQVPPPEQPEEQMTMGQDVPSRETGDSRKETQPAQGDASAEGTRQGTGSSSQEREAGWISLFDGAGLAGWQNAREPEKENRWLVEDGALTNEDHANDISTEEAWRDFELHLEYKIVEGGNSGVYLRGRVEVQILDNYGKEGLDPSDNGGIYGQFAPLVNASKPAGEWNTLEAHYAGDRLTVRLNGRVVLEHLQITEVTGGALPGGVNDPGPLMLQGDHGKIWFRNIKVRPVESDSHRSDNSAPSDSSNGSDTPDPSEEPAEE